MIRKRRPTTRSLVPPTVRREAARRRKSAPQAASAMPIPPATASVEARAEALVAQLRSLGNEENRSGMARFGIRVERAFGVPVTELRRLAKAVGRDHALARALWASGHHEARLLSCFVEDPALVTPRQMEAWVGEIDSWDLCDQAATSLFDLTDHAWSKAAAWAERSEEFTKRAGFALMAGLAMHDGEAPNAAFVDLFPLIEAGASDSRNFVRKAVSWALRNIGKRNRGLNAAAVGCAERIHRGANERAGGQSGGDEAARSARWVATDVFAELTSERVLRRVGRKKR